MKLTSAFSCWFVSKGADDVGTNRSELRRAGMRSLPWGMTKLDDFNFRKMQPFSWVETWATLFAFRAIWKRVHGILIRFDLQKVPRLAYTDDLGWSDGRIWHGLIYQWINSEALAFTCGWRNYITGFRLPRNQDQDEGLHIGYRLRPYA